MPTPQLIDHSIAPSHPIPSRMARILKHQCLLMTVTSLTTLVRNAPNKLLVVSCTMCGPLIQQYSWQYPTLPRKQTTPTENTKKQVNQFLGYMWTHPDVKICYRASDMILNVHSDALYLSAPCARSCAGGCFVLGSLPVDGNPIKLNGTIHITCTILKLVAASAAKAELGALFLNA
jgi:hypothetical protein